MGDIFNIGVSGLLAFQRSLATVGNNIVNANTPGYSRQDTQLTTNQPTELGGAFFGTGVKIGSTRRISDEFFSATLRTNISSNAQFEALFNSATEIDNLVADPSTGMSDALEKFFSAVDGVSNDPSSVPARQVLLTQADILANRFQRLDAQFLTSSENVDEKFTQISQEINALAAGIAELNANIVQASGSANGAQPNDLLDQRDRLLEDLSKKASITAVNTGDGSINVLLGSGETLIVGTTVNQLSTRINVLDTTQNELIITIGGVATPINMANIGGELQGLNDFRENILVDSRNGLGLLAVGIAETFNQQHRLGMDLNGNLGSNFFNDITAGGATSNNLNLGSASISSTITNVSNLKASDYLITFDGNYNITRLSDNANIGSFPPGTSTVTSEGFSITTSGTAVLGDTFLFSPVKTKASDIRVNLTDNKLVAAASPIRATSTIANVGTGTVSQGTVTDVSGAEFTTTPAALTPPLVIIFTSATAYEVHNNSTPPVTLPSAPTLLGAGTITPNTTNNLIPGGLGFGYQVELSGAPVAGDRFEVNYNTGGVSDNRNMLLLSALQTTPTLNSGTASYRQQYGLVVADVGNQTREASISQTSSLSLLRQSQAREDSISGVNLDEEAAKLIQFQNAYQAAAQIISAGSRIIEELIQAAR